MGENSGYHKARYNLYCKLNGYKERKSFINNWGKEDYADIKVKDGEWEHLKHYVETKSLLTKRCKEWAKDNLDYYNNKHSICQ